MTKEQGPEFNVPPLLANYPALPYTPYMHTVIETPEYLRDAKAGGLTDSAPSPL